MADTQRQQKISILIPNLGFGGAERGCVNLANAFVVRGIDVDLVVMSSVNGYASLLDPRVRSVVLQAPRMRQLFSPLRAYLRAEAPTAMLVNMWPLSIIAMLARRLSGVGTRLVAVEHIDWSAADGESPLTRRFVEFTMRRFYPSFDGLVAVSRGAAHGLVETANLPPQSVTTIYNPIVGPSTSDADAKIVGAQRWLNGGHKRLLAVGRLTPQKDYPTMLRAFAKLRSRINARLLILGDGGRQELEVLADELGIADAIDMPGTVLGVDFFYRRADLFVHSAKFEGFGNVIVEALNQGVPVVSTDCPSGPREILSEGRYGKLVPVGDADALWMAMEQALAETHDGELLKARARDFSIDQAAETYLRLLLDPAVASGT